jgi:RNA polymerase sigma-70 factor (ECF subfamily)
MSLTNMATMHSDPGADELEPTRRSLLDRLRNLDDYESWQHFFDTYWKLIYGAALKFGLSVQEAEDVVQETIIGVARKMETFRYDPTKCSFKGWLMCVTERRVIDRLRKRQTRPQSFAPLRTDTATDGESVEIPDIQAHRAFEGMWDTEWENHQLAAAIERVKQRVSPEHYQIYYLRSVKNLEARAVAELLGVGTAKVYVVHHRITRLLRRELKAFDREHLITM